MAKISVLLDTDIGSDIDDAVALSYLLKQPQCELLGVTTVTGDAEKRASLASALCRAAGQPHIPIHVGAPIPLEGIVHQPQAPQAAALTNKWSYQQFQPENTAVEFLHRTILAHPNKITLLTIGGLTNIALLLTLYPETAVNIKSLMMMGGKFLPINPASKKLEWNILCDPCAAARVFQSPIPELTAVGLDVTEQCIMSAEECRRRFHKAGGALSLVADMAEIWFKHSSQIVFHDPLAAALVFDPSLCTLEKGRIEVTLASGETNVVPADTPPIHRYAVSVNPASFFNHYFSVVGG